MREVTTLDSVDELLRLHWEHTLGKDRLRGAMPLLDRLAQEHREALRALRACVIQFAPEEGGLYDDGCLSSLEMAFEVLVDSGLAEPVDHGCRVIRLKDKAEAPA